MYSRSSEPVYFERDCPAIMVPQGDSVTLPAGSYGYITQALGGSYTVFVDGSLFRIAGKDGDAIGKAATLCCRPAALAIQLPGRPASRMLAPAFLHSIQP